MDWSKLGLPAMMRRPRWSRRAPAIGVHFDRERVHWAQLERNGLALRLRDACSVRFDGDREGLLSSPSDLKRLVQTVMRRGRFSGRRIVTGAPTEHLRLMILSYAAEEGRSEAEQILALARERMRDDLSDHVVDYTPIRMSDRPDAPQGERSALVAITPEAPVVEHLERLRQAGLEIAALEIAPIAIRRLVVSAGRHTVPSERDGLALVVRLGAESTDLILLAGRRLLLYREIDVGTDGMTESVVKGLECEAEAAIELLGTFGVDAKVGDPDSTLEFVDGAHEVGAEGEISRTLREILRPSLRSLVEQAHKAISYAAFQLRGTSIDRVHLLEGRFACPGLDGLLSEMLQLPVESFRPLDHIEAPQGLISRAAEPRLALALGHALREVDHG